MRKGAGSRGSASACPPAAHPLQTCRRQQLTAQKLSEDRRPAAFHDRLALRPKEAASALGVSERTLRQMLPELPHVRMGSRVVIPVRLLEEWLRTHAQTEENRVGSEVESILDALGGK